MIVGHHVAEEERDLFHGKILELARSAQRLFKGQEPRQKRRLLNFVLSNCSWEDGEVIATFRQPFDLLAQTTAIATRAAMSSGTNSAKSEIWLGRRDSNLCITERQRRSRAQTHRLLASPSTSRT